MESQALIQIISIVAPIFIAIAGYSIAKKRNRKKWLWFINCLLTGFLGLIVIACSKPLEYDEELDYSEDETLGWVMLIISLLWFGLTFWYGWSAAKSYHDAMVFDAMMQFMRYNCNQKDNSRCPHGCRLFANSINPSYICGMLPAQP